MTDIYDDPIADEECQKADDRRDEEWDQSWFDEMKDQTMENLNAVIETARIMAEHQVPATKGLFAGMTPEEIEMNPMGISGDKPNKAEPI